MDDAGRDFQKGDRVAKDVKTSGRNRGFTAYGTIDYVRADRVGVAWDLRAPHVFPALRTEIRFVRDDEEQTR